MGVVQPVGCRIGADQERQLKALYDRTGLDVLRNENFAADEQMAWEVAAMGVHELGALGCYRGPAKHLYVFFAIDRVAAARRAT